MRTFPNPRAQARVSQQRGMTLLRLMLLLGTIGIVVTIAARLLLKY